MNAATILEEQVLVLNKRWMPLRTVTVQEAIGLVAKGSAMILEPDTYVQHHLVSWNDVSKAKAALGPRAVIRSSYLTLVQPEVIILSKYENQGASSVVFSRRNLFKRDKYTCQYCGSQPRDHSALTVDHLIPRSKGGKSTWDNTVLACVDCNKRKADKTPEQAGMKLRRIPKKPSWKTLMQVNPKLHRESWEAFLSRAYWDVALEE